MGNGLPLGLGGLGQAEAPVYSVAQLNREARALLEETYALVWVEGELSNFHHHRSGHMYFTLKDEAAQLEAAMFRQANLRLTFAPQDGLRVLALGQLTLYEPRGRYQLVVQQLQPAGAGQLQLAFERLKARLQAEGLFDPTRKRPLPPFPQRVGVVTAPGAAALRDVHSVLQRRYPLVEVLLFPAPVQGEGAAQEIARAIHRANRFSRERAPLDVLIVGRGGGALEDLWAFNEEVVARAIAASELPVVSGIGHEVDFTIADFVADVRAPTPSAAAELSVPDRAEILLRVQTRARHLARLGWGRWEHASQRLTGLERSHGLRRPVRRLRDAQQRLDDLQEALLRAIAQRFGRLRQSHALLRAKLEGANPAAVLRRGYAVLRDDSRRVIRRSDQARVGERLSVQLARGGLSVRVEEVLDERAES